MHQNPDTFANFTVNSAIPSNTTMVLGSADYFYSTATSMTMSCSFGDNSFTLGNTWNGMTTQAKISTGYADEGKQLSIIGAGTPINGYHDILWFSISGIKKSVSVDIRYNKNGWTQYGSILPLVLGTTYAQWTSFVSIDIYNNCIPTNSYDVSIAFMAGEIKGSYTSAYHGCHFKAFVDYDQNCYIGVRGVCGNPPNVTRNLSFKINNYAHIFQVVVKY